MNCSTSTKTISKISQLIKVHLDKSQQNNAEHKVEPFSDVCKKFTGKDEC